MMANVNIEAYLTEYLRTDRGITLLYLLDLLSRILFYVKVGSVADQNFGSRALYNGSAREI